MTAVLELEDRIEKCQRLLETDPNSQIFAALAEAYRKRGELDKAFRVCQSGLKVHPSYASAHVVMAKINLDRGLYDWAEAEVRKAMELEGATRVNELLLAEVQIYQGDFEAASRLLRKLHQSDSGNEHIKKLLDIAKKLPAEKARLAAVVQPTEMPPSVTGAMTEVRKLGSKEVLEQALSIPHVTGGLLVNNEGLVTDSEWNLALDPAVCSATMSEIHNFLTRELVKASFGRVQTLLIETGDPVFYLVRVARGMFIFQGTSGINLGTLRMRISSLMEKYDDGR
jgi:predicted regulator of Ras-like GTPase activity (Roadblock/LC7/MglB family)/Flp pilus assembly protein TadD